MAFVTPTQIRAGNAQRSHKRPPVCTRMTISPPASFAAGVETLQNEGAYAVMAAAKALEQRTGKDVIHLEIGQPGFDTPQPIVEAGVQALQSGQTRYSNPAGISSLRHEIARFARDQRGISWCEEANVVVGPGAKPALFFACLALVRGSHDRVIIPDPGFPTYNAMVQVAGGTAVPVKLRTDQRGYNMKALREAVDEDTRVVVVNSPGNPTGGVMPEDDLAELAALAREKDFWVISDEIYAQLCYEDRYVSIGSMEGMADRTVVVDGFSKSYCMTGWRLGWGIMPKRLAERVELLLVHSVGCTATFVQQGGVAALQKASQQVDEVREIYRARRDLVVKGLNAMAGVRCEVPQGAFYAWADVSALGIPVRELAKRLLEEGYVAVLPGTDFGEQGEGFLRLSYVSEEAALKEGLRRMGSMLKRL
ncbi:putative aminotransferase YugH [Gracilariopsis chorda]|uniref:Putative aminotransferase YugH n=1 Tax=Gracilariopsis chorda TaxID=448386 RepID=A0A2V3IL87_9FLOR|nr:putative aminotransferase YugH [Gracilariopsis chorda]|eukprot:PXF42819.1 putative aminotransferase YugH [Gracilariopsis chorda]